MQNFTDVVDILRAHEGVVQVKDAAELERTFAELLSNASREKTRTERA